MATPTKVTGTPPQEARKTLATSGELSPDAPLLYLREWLAAGPAWGRVLIVHGIGEHSGRYERTGRLLSKAGLDVQAFDLRGHGLSGGRRVYVRRWSDYLDDVEGRLAALRRPGLPTVLFGHSMGALISLTYACSNRPTPDLMVLSAPPLKATVPGWQRLLAPALSRVVPNMVLANPIAGEQLAADPNVWAVVPEVKRGDDVVHGHPILVGREMIEAFQIAPVDSTARDVESSIHGRWFWVHSRWRCS